VHDLRVQRLAGGDRVAQGRHLAQLGALGHHAVFGRSHAQHGHALALDQLESLGRVEAGVVQQRGGAAQPRGDERVAGRLGPSAGGGAPGQLTGAGAEPVLGLHALPGQVALAVADRLRRPRGARGEHQQRRRALVQIGRGGGRGLEQALVGNHQQRAGESGVADRVGVAPVAQHGHRLGGIHARAQVARPQLLGARQRHGADPKARHQRQHPLQAVADHGHDHVARADAALDQRARQAGRQVGHLAEGVLAAITRGVHDHQRGAVPRGGVDDVAREVHGVSRGEAQGTVRHCAARRRAARLTALMRFVTKVGGFEGENTNSLFDIC
jgi:hypothetical protein